MDQWDVAAGLESGMGTSSTNFIIPGPGLTIRKPDGWWMDEATYTPLNPQNNNQLASK
jgi:hypothetical protein